MNVAIAMPAEARANTAFEKHLRCYEYIQSEYPIEIDLFTPYPKKVHTDAINPVPCYQSWVESLRYKFQGKQKLLFNNNINYMPEFSYAYNLIIENQYDVVMTLDPTLYPTAYVAYQASKEIDARVIPHASAIKTQQSLVSKRKAKEIIDYSSSISLMSPRTHDRFIQTGLVTAEDDRVFYTGNPINTDIFSPNDGINNNPPQVLTIGVLEERKGFKEISRAIVDLASEGFEFEWHIAGIGELESWIVEYMKDNDLLDRIQMHGLIPHDEIPSLYKNCDIFVLHSKETTLWAEEFGAVFGEAMSSGLPVVGSKSGAVPWVVRDGEDGILVEEGDVAGIVSGLRRLLNDPGERRRMGNNGRNNIKTRFDLGSVAETFHQMWTTET